MFDAGIAWRAMEARREQLLRGAQHKNEEQFMLARALAAFASYTEPGVRQALADVARPGAWPTAELDADDSIFVSFNQRWDCAGDALDWAEDVLADQRVIAIDGSQIPPDPDATMQVAAVQAGWFENPHQRGGRGAKTLEMSLITPDELHDNAGATGGFAPAIVNWRRFELEMRVAIRAMQERAGDPIPPVVLGDMSFVISFVQTMHPISQQQYISIVQEVLETSESSGVPYVATAASRAVDVVDLLKHLKLLPRALAANDIDLIRSQPLGWGDRTIIFTAARDDAVVDNSFYDDVYFCYLSTGSGGFLRVEFPRWLYETGQHERIIDIIRAECVIGNGRYPYPTEAADELAVLSAADRERFYWLLQEFLAQNGVQFSVYPSPKNSSKRERRYR